MAAAAALTQSIKVPSQVSSFHDRCLAFPPLYKEGRDLLREVAGMIQDLRFNIDYLPGLEQLGTHKELCLATARQVSNIYSTQHQDSNPAEDHEVDVSVGIQDKVTAYKGKLEGEMTQISTVIELCEKLPRTSRQTLSTSDIKTYSNLIHDTAFKEETISLQAYCKEVLKTLYLYRLQGLTLQGRIEVLLSKTVKGLETSIAEARVVADPVIAAANPPSAHEQNGWMTALTSLPGKFLNSLHFRGAEDASAPPKDAPKENKDAASAPAKDTSKESPVAAQSVSAPLLASASKPKKPPISMPVGAYMIEILGSKHSDIESILQKINASTATQEEVQAILTSLGEWLKFNKVKDENNTIKDVADVVDKHLQSEKASKIKEHLQKLFDAEYATKKFHTEVTNLIEKKDRKLGVLISVFKSLSLVAYTLKPYTIPKHK
jgi:hypothetical protein